MAIKISGTTVIDNSQNITNAGIVTATSFTGDGSQLTNLPGGGGNTLEATATGTLADGSKVIVNADGTVSVVAQTETTGAGTGSAETFEGRTNGADYISAAFDSNSNRVVLFYRQPDYSASTYHGTAVVGEISGGSVTFGSPVIFDTYDTSAGAVVTAAAFDSTNNKVVVAYRKYTDIGGGASTKYHEAKVGTVDPSNNSITFGAATVINSNGESSDVSMTFDPSSGKIVVAYRDEGNDHHGTAKVGTISGTSISFGSANVFYDGGSTVFTALVADTSTNRVVLASMDGSTEVNVRVGQVSGTSITFGSATAIYSDRSDGGISIAFDASTNKVVVVRTNQSNLSNPYRVYAHVITVDPSNNSISYGSGQQVTAKGYPGQLGIAYDSSSEKLIIVYKNGNASYQLEYLHATVDGSNNTIAFSSATVVDTNNNSYYGVIHDSNVNQSLIFYQNDASKYGTANVVGLTGFPVPETGSTAVFESAHADHIKAVYDSANGKVVIAYQDRDNSDYGTAVVGTVSGTSISFGTPAVFESASTSKIVVTYDSYNEKVVIAYRDNGNSYYGTAIVGTVSGTSISFGSPTVYQNTGQLAYNSITYDSSNQKVVVAYQDPSDGYGKARVGTVSGDSITFGSTVTFESADTHYIAPTFDSTNNKVVIAYKDNANSGRGTAIVGTVSGTSISFGSATVFESGEVEMEMSAVYDSTNQKVVIAYVDGSNSYYGTAVVGEVSGTGISFGTPVVFESSSIYYISAAYDSANGKVIIAYKDNSNSHKATAIVGTVSGTSISFGSPNAFVSTVQEHISAAYDSANQKVVIAFNDKANSKYGTAFTFSSRTISRNLTAENFIGISDGAYSNGQTATIQLTGAVDDAQSSLTPGQSYYVQNDGTLSTSADNPSVFAGTALASTKLIVRG